MAAFPFPAHALVLRYLLNNGFRQVRPAVHLRHLRATRNLSTSGARGTVLKSGRNGLCGRKLTGLPPGRINMPPPNPLLNGPNLLQLPFVWLMPWEPLHMKVCYTMTLLQGLSVLVTTPVLLVRACPQLRGFGRFLEPVPMRNFLKLGTHPQTLPIPLPYYRCILGLSGLVAPKVCSLPGVSKWVARHIWTLQG